MVLPMFKMHISQRTDAVTPHSHLIGTCRNKNKNYLLNSIIIYHNEKYYLRSNTNQNYFRNYEILSKKLINKKWSLIFYKPI